ncbi:MAG: Deacetylases, including yeast histone deacetylase and acetoin utilization protein [uncultured Chloroflexi bacterium]|uniref:Deacetylases, including yeast histone deacetylase and acetoin utilization protein n=1 Tax=uncultured Chloroflexota bacterium TaxID=166587 RepID=A0A6J4ISJ3_9CHLR|nr:MAG: Deacetylases, including yeast histone deacetylase and acetoin utilization protein [uncultured Chloroflexota bacterium]
MVAGGPQHAAPAAFVYRHELAEAELRPGHPLKPVRARTCLELLERRGVFASGGVRVVSPGAATREDVLRVHDAGYVAMVERLSGEGRVSGRDAAGYGFSEQGDNPPFSGMYDYYLLVCGAAIEAVRLVDEGEADCAFMPAGGVNHHAMPDRASGFGVFNDAAVAIAWLRERGRRVMYVDLDVHQGDGVEAMFEDDDRVLTVSLHESTRFLFPGPKGGFAENTGAGNGTGYSVNVPLAPYTDDETWLWAFDQVVPPLYGAFKPDVLLVQLGADGYHADPLAHLQLTARAYRSAAARLRELTGGRLAAVGGGGYDVEATPRIWAAELLELAGLPGAEEVAPSDLAPVLDSQPASKIRRFAEDSVATVQRLVFPVHGLRS